MLARSLVRNTRFHTCFLSLVAAVSLTFGAVPAQAAGLGEILFTSNLNEPLNATIELRDLNGLGADEVLVSFAPVENFRQAGLEYSAYLDDITIEVIVLDGNNGRLFLTSEKPIVEPYLSFLLDMYWPSGRVQQEYTILLDLPVLSSGAGTQSPVSEARAPARAATATPAQAASVQEDVEYVLGNPDSELDLNYEQDANATTTTVAQPGGSQYVIQAGDTLWEIAEQVRPTTSVTVPQTMLSIQRSNPQAFPNGNINLIRPLQVLNIPPESEIRSISPEDANQEVSNQNRQFQGLQVEPLTLNRVETNSSQQAPSDELALVSTDEEGQSGAANSGTASAAMASLENKLLVAEETVDRLRVENEELTSRLADLNNQIELLENIAVLKDQQLAELQGGATGESLVTAESPELARVEQAITSEPVQAPVAQPAASPAPAPASIQEKVLAAVTENQTLVAAGAGLLVAFFLGLLIYRRVKNRDDEDFDDEDQDYYLEDADDEDEQSDDKPAARTEEKVAAASAYSSKKPSRDDDLYSILDLNDVDETLSKTGTRDNPHERTLAADTVHVNDDQIDDVEEQSEAQLENQADESAESISGEDDDEIVISAPVAAAAIATGSEEQSEDLEALEFTLSELPEPLEEDTQQKGQEDDLEEFESITFPSPGTLQTPKSEEIQISDIQYEDSTEDSEKSESGNTDTVDFGNLTFGEDSAAEDDDSSDDDAGKEATKIDLAVAYEAMGDIDGAREMLQEVLADGSAEEKKEANKLLDEWKEL